MRVGITAGASTPNNKIGDVVDANSRDARTESSNLMTGDGRRATGDWRLVNAGATDNGR